jgi:hypothetical protein
MRYALFLLLPFALAATRYLAFGIQSSGKLGARPTILAEAEYELLINRNILSVRLAGRPKSDFPVPRSRGGHCGI